MKYVIGISTILALVLSAFAAYYVIEREWKKAIAYTVILIVEIGLSSLFSAVLNGGLESHDFQSESEIETKENINILSEEITEIAVEILEAEDIVHVGEWYHVSSTYYKGIAFRENPKEEAYLIERLPYGTVFYVNAAEGLWARTEIDGEIGWIQTEYAELGKSNMGGETEIEIGEWYHISSTYYEGIALRKEPSEEAELIKRFPYGTDFYVKGAKGLWAQAEINGEMGWIQTEYAELGKNNMSDEIEIGEWYHISSTYSEGIALRKEPSGEAELIKRFPYGTDFYVEGAKGLWAWAKIDGEVGWICTKYAECGMSNYQKT